VKKLKYLKSSKKYLVSSENIIWKIKSASLKLRVFLDEISETGNSINFQINSHTLRTTSKFMLKVKS
jgi:hypothetical protein